MRIMTNDIGLNEEDVAIDKAFPIKIGEFFDGSFTEQYLMLCCDECGYCLDEISWHYNAGKQTQLSRRRIDDNYFVEHSFDDFCKFIRKEYNKYETKRCFESNESLKLLFAMQKKGGTV